MTAIVSQGDCAALNAFEASPGFGDRLRARSVALARTILCLGGATWLSLAQPVQAQTRPDAGSLRQQIETERDREIPKSVAPPKPAEPPAMKPQSGVTITVKRFRFAGSTLVPDDKLAAAVAGYLDRSLDFAQLQAAAAAVAEVYREAGWVVRAYLPEQDIADGVVTIQIIEAVFGRIRIEDKELTRVPATRLAAIVNAQQKHGDPVDAVALDRALLLADDFPGVAAAGTLQEGANHGETDLVLKLGDKPVYTANLGMDDSGARSTGPIRYTATGSLVAPLGYGELVSANVIHSSGSDYDRLAAYLPIGDDGFKVGVNGSHLEYTLGTAAFRDLNAVGTSDSFGIEASYPLLRSRQRNLYASVNADRKLFDNESLGQVTSRYSINSVTAGLNGNLFDNLGGGGANSAGLTVVAGRVNLDGSPNQSSDAASTKTAGLYGKLQYQMSRQQVITEDLFLFFSLSGQRAQKNLDSSEKLYLGGASGVRAYPVNEAGGSDGNMMNLELRRKLPEGFSAVAFFDWGRVIVNHDNNSTGRATPNGIALKGAGLSLSWASDFGLNLKGTWAHRIDDNPNPTIAGNDQDGSLVRNRLWFTVSYQF